MRGSLLPIFAVLCFAGPSLAEPPLLYLPMDGSADPAVSAAVARPLGGSLLEFRDGVRGQAARLDADCRLLAPGCFRAEAGTIACWLRPVTDVAERGERCIFCRYGDAKLARAWCTNRLSISLSGRVLRMSIYPARGERPTSAEAPLSVWPAGTWRHLAATWKNINSGRADAELCLFVDGRLAARRGGLRLDVGPMSERLDIGRDSDNSPDYARADCDEFYIYGRPLSEREIQAAVAAARNAGDGVAKKALRGGARTDGWWNNAWPLRCRVSADWPRAGGPPAVRLPLDMALDVAALGIRGRIDPDSLRVVACDPRTGKLPAGAEPLQAMVEADSLLWMPAAGQAAGGRIAAEVYFDVVRVNTDVPLLARTESPPRPAPARAKFTVPDFATETYGDAWDFDEGDFEAIDGFGNRDYGIKKKEVRDGKLCLDVCDDPFFIWGDMWSNGAARTHRPVRIDLARYPVLAMKVRQSCPRAQWRVYGRSAAGMSSHEFTVTGTGWQVVRVDLVREARFGGVLEAFRIDPTEEIHAAHVEIDWIRLVREVQADREPVEALPEGNAAVARLDLSVERQAAPCGSRQEVVVRATDAAGKPVPASPVTLRLAPGSRGQLAEIAGRRSLALGPQARRGLTDADGRLTVELESSRRAARAADVLEARADLTALAASTVVVAALAGPPHHYQVEPVRAACVSSGRFPLPVSVQVVDQYDNPLPVAGRKVILSVAEGGSLKPDRLVTDAGGRGETRLSVDPARRWVYRIDVRDGQGLTGQSAAISLALDAPRPKYIRLLPNGYFAWSDGRPFIPLGGFYANWVQEETPDGEWSKLSSFTDTTDQQKLRWMEFLHQSGVTAMRMMLRTHRPNGMEPMDVCGRVNQPLLAESLRTMDLARRFGLQFQLVVHEDYSKPVYFNAKAFEQYTLPAFAGEDLDRLAPEQRRFVRDRRLIAPIGAKYTDPDVLACQDRYVAELLPALKNNPQVMAYELENEMVDCPASWAGHAVGTLHRLDPRTLVCASHGGGGLETADPDWWHRNTPVDFYNYHLYPQGSITRPDLDYGAAVALLVRYGRMCGVNLLGESSGDQFRMHPNVETRRFVMRDIIWMSLTGGVPGVFFWNARGAEVREFRFAREAMESLDLASFRRTRPEIGIDVRHPLADDKWYRTPAGHKAYAMMGRYVQHYLSEGVDFDFTLKPASYRRSCSLDSFAPASPGKRPISAGPGWQVSHLERDDGRAMLIYVRNYAATEMWQCAMGRQPWQQYLRRRQAAPLRLGLALSDRGPHQATVCDLDRQTRSTRPVKAGEAIDLGATDHDFLIVLKRVE